MYNSVIFDLDGTLLNTIDDLSESVNFALSSNGFSVRNIDEIRSFVGNGVKKLVERSLPVQYSENQFDKVFGDFLLHYQVHCLDKTKPYDGIIDLLRVLKAKSFKIGIASNKVHPAVEKLNELFFCGLVDCVCGAVEGKPVKPDPFIVNSIVEKMGSAKNQILYVGDSQVDIETANNVGLDIVCVLWGFRNRSQLENAGGKYFVEKPSELLDFLCVR